MTHARADGNVVVFFRFVLFILFILFFFSFYLLYFDVCYFLHFAPGKTRGGYTDGFYFGGVCVCFFVRFFFVLVLCLPRFRPAEKPNLSLFFI